MKTKPLPLLLIPFLIFLFAGDNFVYGEELEVKKEYWENGKLKSETHYKNGKKDGPATRWNENGNKKRENHYKNGKRDGLWTTWDENGNKRTEKHYKNGKEQ